VTPALPPARQIAQRTRKALAALGCASTCPVFLMTNCQNRTDIDEVAARLPSAPVRYVPPAPEFAQEGHQLLIEAAIAARAATFVGSPRSAVSDLVETLRRARRVERSMPTGGRMVRKEEL